MPGASRVQFFAENPGKTCQNRQDDMPEVMVFRLHRGIPQVVHVARRERMSVCMACAASMR